MQRSFLIAVLLVCGFVVPSCVTSPRASKIVPIAVGPAARIPYSVRIEVDPKIRLRPDTSAGGSYSQRSFAEVVEAAIIAVGPFEAVVDDATADYVLFVSLIHVEIRGAGPPYSIDSEAVAEWRLVDTRGKSPVFRDSVSGAGHSNFGDAIGGFTRASIARERALGDNIDKGLHKIRLLDLAARATG